MEGLCLGGATTIVTARFRSARGEARWIDHGTLHFHLDVRYRGLQIVLIVVVFAGGRGGDSGGWGGERIGGSGGREDSSDG